MRYYCLVLTALINTHFVWNRAHSDDDKSFTIDIGDRSLHPQCFLGFPLEFC